MITNEDSVHKKIAKCRQALDDALLLLNNERYIASVNRMYYAAFYVATAYLAYKNIIVKSHKGVRVQVHQEMVNLKLLSADEGKTFDLLFVRRTEFDYADFVTYSVKDIIKLFADTEAFIQKIETLITIND